jgi:ABC-type glycerol-3-phosphate transport system substrate-binding protein
MSNQTRQGIAAVFLISLLSACAGSPPALTAPSAPSDLAPMTLTFWHTQTGAGGALIDTFANDFHKTYPAITLRGEAKKDEGDLLRAGIAAMAQNQTPDFILADNRTIGAFARKDALVPLDPLLNDPSLGLSQNDRADFFPGLLDSGRFPDLKNQLFSFPFDEHAIVLYYNVDLLQAAKAAAPPRTWDQFSAAARSTTNGDTRGWVMPPNAAVFYSFVLSQGGSVLNDAQTQAQFDGDAGMKSLQMIAALTKGGSAYLVDSADAARADFAQGKAALLFGTTDDLPALSDAVARAGNTFQWGVANVPQNDPAHPLTIVYGANIAIFNRSPERTRAAWLFARWLAEPAQTARWSRATMAIPLRTSALPLLASSASDPLFQRLRDGFGDTLPSGRALPAVQDAAQMDAAIVEMWTAVANGTDPAAAMSSAAARVNRLLGP